MNSESLQIVKSVVEDLSAELGYDGLHEVSSDTALFGGPDSIDSLSLVRIVAEVERVAEEKLGKRVVLADERAMSSRNSPFRSIGTLADLLTERMGE